MTEQKIICGDNIEVMKTMEDNSVDSIVTDCPYGLGVEPDPFKVMKDWIEQGYHVVKGTGGFMNKEWDKFVPQPNFWKEAHRVLKPRGHVLAFFGTRTYDWGVMAMRFAGFEIRDQIDFIYGTGFPKSLNIKKAVEKFIKNEQCNCLDRIDGIGLGEDVRCGSWEKVWLQRVACKREKESIRDTIISFKESGGESSASDKRNGNNSKGNGGFVLADRLDNQVRGHDDEGGASRFFYIAKPTAFEKERGLKNFELKDPATVTDFRPTLKSNPENWSNGTETPYTRTTQRKNIHPTVKPVNLLRYLVKMVTAKGGVCLDPYNGSGTTGIACKMEGINYIGIEQNEYDCEISKSRIAIWSPENIQQQLL